jgi:hypothetical protein
VRPVLNVNTGGTRRRAIALLEHKPWAADDGKRWLAAFRWPDGAGSIESAELEVGPGLIVSLPAPGGKANTALRVSALRPHVPTPPSRKFHTEDELGPEGDEPSGRAAETAGTGPGRRAGRRSSTEWTPAPPRDVLTAALAERDEAAAARDEAERERVTALNDRDDALSRRDAALRDVDRAGAERDDALAERDRLASELERITRERDIAHAERNRTLQDLEAVARERDQAAAERDAARSELSRVIPARADAIRERDSEAARADRAESERDTAFAERKSAVAQRDRARRERDRAMRAAGVEPPEESPYLAPARLRGDRSSALAADAVASAEPARPAADAPAGTAADAGAAVAEETQAAVPESSDDAAPRDAPATAAPPATPPGTALPSRPVKRIGTGAAGPGAEPKPLLTPVDGGRPRRLSRTRRAPSAPARWAVRIVVVALLLAITAVLVMLLGSAL